MRMVLLLLAPGSALGRPSLAPIFALLLDDDPGINECGLPNGYEYGVLSANRSWGYQVNTAPAFVRYGADSLRFELRPGDCGGYDCTRNPPFERTEVGQEEPYRSPEGDEIWYGWSFYVPADFKDGGNNPNSARGTSFVQFQQCCLFDPVFMFIKHYGDAFKVSSFRTLQPTHPFKVFDLISDADFRGRWHDFVIHAKWTLKDDGFL